MQVHSTHVADSRLEKLAEVSSCSQKFVNGLFHPSVPFCLSVGRYVCQSVYVCLSFSLTACLNVCQSVIPSFCLSVCPSLCPSVPLSVHPSVCLSIYVFLLSVRMTLHLSVCLSVGLSVCGSLECFYWGRERKKEREGGGRGALL